MIDTSFLDADTDKIKAARPALLDMANSINQYGNVVSSIADLRALDKTKAKHALVTGYYAAGDGGGGRYYCDSTDTTSTDNGGTVIVATDGGRWKLVHDGAISVLQFGAKGDDATDDQPAFAAAIAYLTSLGVPARGGACGKLRAPAARTYKWGAGISINVPIEIDVEGFIDYTPAAGVALTIGTSYAYNQAYRMRFAGFKNSSGNTGQPTAINAAGTTAVQVNSMNFSGLEIGVIEGFTKTGVYLNGSGDLGFQQVIQHNKIRLGQVVNNGNGLKLLSLDAATSSAEANRIYIQNAYQNFSNVLVDDSTHNASTSNTFDINSMDNNAAAGVGLDMWGYYNHVYIGYTASQIKLNTSNYNTVHVQNNLSSGPIISYGSGENWVTTGTPDASQLPASGVTIELGQVYQNNYGVPVVVYFNANVAPSTSDSEIISVHCGKSTAPAEVFQFGSASMSNPDTKVFPVALPVPPGYYWSVWLRRMPAPLSCMCRSSGKCRGRFFHGPSRPAVPVSP